MTDDEILKALTCCSENDGCMKCPFFYECKSPIKMAQEIMANALDLINRQKAEIERRKNNLFCKVVIDEETMRNIINEKVQEFELDIKSIKAEAIKEFAERLKEKMTFETSYFFGIPYYRITERGLNGLAKEMVGEG